MKNAQAVSVVVVESQPLMLTALSAALSAEGMAVVAEVGDSGQAVQTVQRFKPRVVLFSASGLPDLERISALRHEFPASSILALVSGDYRGQARLALDYGAHAALTKAASRAELLEAVKELLDQREFQFETITGGLPGVDDAHPFPVLRTK